MYRHVLSLVAMLGSSVIAAEPPDFDRQVAPILASRCLDCHSGGEAKGKLDLSQSKLALAGGESGAAIEAGQPAASLLWKRIEANEMPPKHPLPAAERETIKAWIAAGAKWGTDPIDPYRYSTAARAGYDWWSLQPLTRPTPPAAADSRPHANPIDAFIVEGLRQKGLTPSPPADRRVLIRRLYFDLIGLPPSPAEIDAFVADPAGDAYDLLVGRLLESPHYGERWARHWLDVAHFGESDGYEYDKMRPHAWRYRDWVIEALNRDLPFDEFARLQIAGDVLRPEDPQAIVATGFLVAGAHDGLLPKGEAMRQIMRQDELEDLVAIVGQTFLGLTVNCARCHDHKFDPILQTDYYRLASALAGVKRGNRDIGLAPPVALVQSHDQVAKELDEIVAAGKRAVLARRQVVGEMPPPRPIASWDFDGDLADSVGGLDGVAHGGARVENGALVLDGKQAYVATSAIDKDLVEKTLEAWVQLDSLDQRGGGAIVVQSPSGEVFDGIVFAEQAPRRWVAGSDFFRRTQPFAEAADEAAAGERFVHLAIVYRVDGQILAYRDGQPYGKPYQSQTPARFEQDKTQVVFGLRHAPAGANKMLAGKIDRARLYDRALTADEIAASAGTPRTDVTDEELTAALDEPARVRKQQLAEELGRLHAQVQSYRDRKVFAVTPQPAPVAHLLVRGNANQPAEAVAPGGIVSLASTQPDFALPPDAADADRRRKLAEWIARPENPLFARTIANRLWHYHFGRGLIDTPSDLGFSGGHPSHPQLLDWLAAEIIDKKWSLKQLHRAIVTSATYRQASQPRPECEAVDADNRLVWRFSPRRLEAEGVRDAMLVAAGQFNPLAGGPSVQDFRPYEYKSAQYYEPIDPVGPQFNRRSLYRMWARGGKNPLLDTFDCPDPSMATPKRGSTTTPLQALALLNNSFTLRMADHFAERLGQDLPGDLPGQVSRAFELTYGRPASDAERQSAAAFAGQHGLPALCRVLLNSNGFLYVN